MAGTNNRYVYGSAAEKIKQEPQYSPNSKNSNYYDPYEQNAVLKSKKAARYNAKLKKRIVVNIFLVFGMCAIIMSRYAQISQMNYDNIDRLIKSNAATVLILLVVRFVLHYECKY